jgi:D-alanyl-D-alanine carboxypeptidase (penicillin-binding protein 5/6)
MAYALRHAWTWIFLLLAFPGSRSPAWAQTQMPGAPTAPEVGAKTGVLWNPSRRAVLWERKKEEVLPLGSTAKLMTALLVTQKTGLFGEVTIARSDIITAGPGYAPTVRLLPGDRIPVRELVKALLVASSNEAANALARYCSGSVPRFVREMNQAAQEMGCRTAHFADPHGLSAETRASAWELLHIFERFLAFAGLARLASLESEVLRDSDGRPLQLLFSTNRLSGIYPGLAAAKTGWTTAAGHTYVVLWNQGDQKAILVLLGSTDPWHDAWRLLDYAQACYRYPGSSPGQ